MSWYLHVLKNYATFRGRARRKEFWMFVLVHMITVFALVGLYAATEEQTFYYAYVLYFLGTLLPTIAAMVRRLHDTNRSGGWYFINFIPIIGGFWLLALLSTAGDRNANMYGPDPKAA